MWLTQGYVNRNKIKDFWFPCLAAKPRLFELWLMDSGGAGCFLVFFLVVCNLEEQSKWNTSIHCFPGHSPTIWLAVCLLPICLLSRAQAPFFFQSAVHLCCDIASFPLCICHRSSKPLLLPHWQIRLSTGSKFALLFSYPGHEKLSHEREGVGWTLCGGYDDKQNLLI